RGCDAFSPACSFFFQAEDGIRDFHVTGVQTCALPICVIAKNRVRLVHHVPKSGKHLLLAIMKGRFEHDVLLRLIGPPSSKGNRSTRLDKLTKPDVLLPDSANVPRRWRALHVVSEDLSIMLYVWSSPGISPVSRATRSVTVIITN